MFVRVEWEEVGGSDEGARGRILIHLVDGEL